MSYQQGMINAIKVAIWNNETESLRRPLRGVDIPDEILTMAYDRYQLGYEDGKAEGGEVLPDADVMEFPLADGGIGRVSTDSQYYDEIVNAIQVYGSNDKLKPDQMSGAIHSIVEDVTKRGYDDGYLSGERDGYRTGKSEGETQGRQDQHNEFWVLMLNNGNRCSYMRSFGGARWTDSTFNPPETFKMVASNMQACFHSSEIENINIVIDISSITNSAYLNGAFYGGIFKKIQKLEISDKTAFHNATFQGCTALEDIDFKGTLGTSGFDIHWSTKLSKNSLLNIFKICNKASAGVSITLPSKCIDGKTVTETYIENDTELSTSLFNATTNGYTITYS